ncbi:cell division protein DivIC [Geomicrobium halophilum]|uniref:Cell division protein DivIC n=1 Tax=Geomicrobium halophilum TaxID=549000 RepID=A0A841PXR6_9BACL|nr:septum formation initiator family protein [Geomicrobium halophilum]MBB6451551.1 cell division protein DivIC [Geomicrobium halophilum]
MAGGPNRKVTQLKRDKMHEQEQERLALQEERRKRGLVRRLTTIGILAAVVVIFAGIALVSQQSMIEANEEEKAELKAQLDDMEAEQQSLETKIKNYNDEEYITEIARRDLYLTKPEETIIKVPEEEN